MTDPTTTIRALLMEIDALKLDALHPLAIQAQHARTVLEGDVSENRDIYIVCLQQYVEKLATVEVYALGPFDAIEQAKADYASSAVWGNGDDAHSVEAYAVLRASDKQTVWER